MDIWEDYISFSYQTLEADCDRITNPQLLTSPDLRIRYFSWSFSEDPKTQKSQLEFKLDSIKLTYLIQR